MQSEVPADPVFFSHYDISYICMYHVTLLLRRWYEIMALYNVKSILTEILASRQDKRVLQKSKVIRIKFFEHMGYATDV